MGVYVEVRADVAGKRALSTHPGCGRVGGTRVPGLSWNVPGIAMARRNCAFYHCNVQPVIVCVCRVIWDARRNISEPAPAPPH